MHRRIRSILAANAAAALLAGATAASAGTSGAIFTTNEDGTWVNGNVYDSKEAVYLNGGPRANQSCTAAGLPDGEYYFQVTDPAGTMLLSTDAIVERRILVAAGVIVEYLGATHATGSGRCGTVTVALGAPKLSDPPPDPLPDPLFGNTPNPGGEYKVWVTRTDVYDLVSFQPSSSKTDNFKVQAADEPDVDDGDGD
jgi:hypothetical protein